MSNISCEGEIEVRFSSRMDRFQGLTYWHFVLGTKSLDVVACAKMWDLFKVSILYTPDYTETRMSGILIAILFLEFLFAIFILKSIHLSSIGFATSGISRTMRNVSN